MARPGCGTEIRRFKFRIGTVDFALLQMFFEKNVFKQICKDRIGTVGLAPRQACFMARPNRGLSSAGSSFEVGVEKTCAMKFAKIV